MTRETREHLERWLDRLMAYVEGTLPKPDVEEVQRHLASCHACQVLLENIQRLREQLQVLESELRLSPEARLRLYQRLNEERRKRGDAPLTIPQALLEEVRRQALDATEATEEEVKK